MLMLGVYVSRIDNPCNHHSVIQIPKHHTTKAIKLYYNVMITTEAYIVCKVMKLGALMSVCLRLVTQFASSVGEASPSTLIT